MSEFLVVGLAAHPLSPSFCCRSVWHQECKLDGVRRKTKTSKNFSIFSDVGWLVGWYGTRAPRENETDRHPPSPFLSTSCQSVGRSVGRVAIVSSTMKKRDSWTRFGTEITALAAGKEERGKRGEEISGLWRRRICRSFHAFSRRPFGATRRSGSARCKRRQKRNRSERGGAAGGDV